MPYGVRKIHGSLLARTLIVVLVGMVIFAACSVPFFDDDDPVPTDQATPTAAPEDIREASPTPEEGDDPVVRTGQDDWIIITGPERRDVPESRNADQVLRLNGTPDGPSTLDPALVRDANSAFLARQVFRGLIRLNTDLEPIPDLAERVEISPDGRIYRFQLRDGVTFHDGSPITAREIKASLERASDPALLRGDAVTLPSRMYLEDIEGAVERMAGERDDIPGIEVIDELALEITLVRGVVDFLERLANPIVYIVDVSSIDGDEWWRSPNGSGPFKVEEWDPDRELRLIAHDGYAFPPHLAEVSIRMGREAVGEIRLYEADLIDVAGVSISVIDRFDYAGSPYEEHLVSTPLHSTTFATINRNIAPYSERELREALMRGFPREMIPDVMLDGRVPVAGGILPSGMDPAGESSFPFPFDPEQAETLFESSEASVEEDSLTIFTSGGAIPSAMKEIYDDYGAFDIEVVRLRWSDYLEDLDDRRLPFFVISWVADSPDPASLLRALFHSDSPDNYIDFSDEEVDRLLDEAAVEQDDQRRDELIQEAHQQILESAVVMPLYHGVDYMLVSPAVRGLPLSPMGILGLEDVWIED